MNSVVLLGRLTKDPELKTTTTGKSVCSFSLAVDRAYKQDNGPTADFFDIVAWGKQAETISQYLRKGRQLCVRGRLQQQRWTTQSGENRSKVEVVLESFSFCGSKDASGSGASAGSAPSSQRDDNFPLDIDDDFSLLADDDEIPFP